MDINKYDSYYSSYRHKKLYNAKIKNQQTKNYLKQKQEQKDKLLQEKKKISNYIKVQKQLTKEKLKVKKNKEKIIHKGNIQSIYITWYKQCDVLICSHHGNFCHQECTTYFEDYYYDYYYDYHDNRYYNKL